MWQATQKRTSQTLHSQAHPSFQWDCPSSVDWLFFFTTLSADITFRMDIFTDMNEVDQFKLCLYLWSIQLLITNHCIFTLSLMFWKLGCTSIMFYYTVIWEMSQLELCKIIRDYFIVTISTQSCMDETKVPRISIPICSMGALTYYCSNGAWSWFWGPLLATQALQWRQWSSPYGLHWLQQNTWPSQWRIFVTLQWPAVACFWQIMLQLKYWLS